MRLASYSHDGQTGFGVVDGGDLVDLTGLDGMGSVYDALQRGLPTIINDAVSSDKFRRIGLPEVNLLPPLAGAGRNFWVGANYRTLKSNRDGSSPTGDYPSLFQRTPQSLVGHGSGIARPRCSDQLDYEGEVVIVIGKRGRHVSKPRALDHIAGLTIANDGSVRDFMDHGRNVTAGKNFDASGAMGPWIVTCDQLDPGLPMAIETRVNGELRQTDTTASMRFSFADLIAYISGFVTLMPGDLIATGSPQGAGGGPFGFDPPRWLVPGDVIEIAVEGIGTLRNEVVEETGHPESCDPSDVERQASVGSPAICKD